MSSPSSPSAIVTDSELSRQSDPLTLTRFLLAERARYRDASGSFTMLLQSIQLACKVISNATRRAGIAQLFGVAGNQNATGDDQKKLDILANDIMINCLKFSDQVYILGSEESDEPVILDHLSGGYAVVFDPLDGSSNIDCQLSVGTIFGIYKKDPKSNSATSVKDILKPGNQLLAAGYALYDAATMIVLTTGDGVNGFTLDPSIGEFILTHKNIQIPPKGKIYSINEGNANAWDAATTEFIQLCKENTKAGGPKSGRYVGSMVGDIHRTLLYGGIFAYPADKKATSGKLRLLYECNPMSMLIEQAGGVSTTGTQRILDIVPKALHQRVPIWAGSRQDVQLIQDLYQKYNIQPGGKLNSISNL